jgi:hypothetical protein
MMRKWIAAVAVLALTTVGHAHPKHRSHESGEVQTYEEFKGHGAYYAEEQKRHKDSSYVKDKMSE